MGVEPHFESTRGKQTNKQRAAERWRIEGVSFLIGVRHKGVDTTALSLFETAAQRPPVRPCSLTLTKQGSCALLAHVRTLRRHYAPYRAGRDQVSPSQAPTSSGPCRAHTPKAGSTSGCPARAPPCALLIG